MSNTTACMIDTRFIHFRKLCPGVRADFITFNFFKWCIFLLGRYASGYDYISTIILSANGMVYSLLLHWSLFNIPEFSVFSVF